MSLFTLIARSQDGLLLTGTQHDSTQLPELKRQAKRIVKNIKSQQPKVSIDAGKYSFHYLIEYDVCYLVLAENSYPTGLAFCYLEELALSFYAMFGESVYQTDNSWSCMSFVPQLAQIRSEFLNPRAPKNMQRINDKLDEVQDIMRENLSDIMQRGTNLQSMQRDSELLQEESSKFKKGAKYINFQAMMQQYTIPAVIAAVILLLVVFKLYL